VPCLAVAGVVRLSVDRLTEAGFVAAHGLGEVEPDVQRCLAEPEPLLAELAARVLPPHLPAADQRASSSPRA
jgi:glycerate kinase